MIDKIGRDWTGHVPKRYANGPKNDSSRDPQDTVKLGGQEGADPGADLRKAAMERGDGVELRDDGWYKSFPGRQGYDENFLGVKLPMPQLDESLKASAAPLIDDPSKNELKYTHFSVIQNKDRMAPMLTAVNIDGAQYQEVERKKDTWAFDSRIERQYQVNNVAYSNSAIDRGHHVRRKDATWGSDAAQGGDDTFVYTNAGLQHADLNRKRWLDLENNVLMGAVANHEKKTVFTGPVLRDDDPTYNNNGRMHLPTKMPQAFWKVEVWNEPGVGLVGEAFVLSQREFLGKERSQLPYEQIKPMEFKNYRVTMAQLESMTHIRFGGIGEGKDRTLADAAAAAAAGLLDAQGD